MEKKEQKQERQKSGEFIVIITRYISTATLKRINIWLSG